MMTSENYRERESIILKTVSQKSVGLFHSHSATLNNKNPHFPQAYSFVKELLKGFPEGPNGSQFVKCRFYLEPRLIVASRDLKPIVASDSTNNLLRTIAGSTLQVGPLNHPIFGAITKEERTLELRDIRWPNSLHPIKQPTDLKGSKLQVVMLNNEVEIGDSFRGQNPSIAKVIAATRFGQFSGTQLMLDAIGSERGDPSTLLYSIPLPVTAGTIAHDGTVTLSNKSSFNLNTLPGMFQGTFIGTTFTYTAHLFAPMASS